MKAQTIIEIIRNRSSVFPSQYNSLPVSEEFVRQLLDNANCAPSHKKTDPWRFKVVMNEAKTKFGNFLADTYVDITPPEKFSVFKRKKIIDKCEASSVIIVICMQRDPKERVPEWEELAATAMAVQNMWLTCTANKVGCYWSSPKLISYVGDFFEMKEGESCLGFFYLGNYDAIPDHKIEKKPIGDKVEWIK